jgi:hypothetical protein
MKEIKARDGYYLADPQKENFYKAVKGASVDPVNYIEVPEEEAEAIMKQRESEAMAEMRNQYES